MPTHYNEKEQEICDFIVSMGKSVNALQDQLGLANMTVGSLKIKIIQYESMTGIASRDLPHENKMPDWDYMLKHTTRSNDEEGK